MPVEVIMPKVDMDMTSGKVSVWHVEEGAQVAKGAPLFDIETDKAAMEVESPASGRLHNVIAQPGETVEVGRPLAWIYAEGEAVAEPPAGQPVPLPAARPVGPPAEQAPHAESTAPAAAFQVDQQAEAATQPAYGSSAASGTPLTVPGTPPTVPAAAPFAATGSDGVRATPAARRLARENGLALQSITGTGPRSRIQGADVAEALRARESVPARAREPEPAARETFAEALPRTWDAEAGELYVSTRKGTGTPLVLIHGFAADSTGWAPLERTLPKDLPLIRIDLPSHGRSPRRRIDSFRALSRAVSQAFDAAASGPVHLLGHSLGGALALAIADIRPRQIASLTLIAPAGLDAEIDAPTLLGIARASQPESLGPWLRRLTATADGVSWDFVRAAMLARNDPICGSPSRACRCSLPGRSAVLRPEGGARTGHGAYGR
jgi:pyruvate dehydrogenase E2 component (dihydrolipoamide acetyltransferase)